MKRALIINLGWEQQPLIDRLRQSGFALFGIHAAGGAGRLRAAELAEHFHEIHLCDLRDLPAVCEFADRVRPDLVLSDQCDYSHFAQAVVAERWNLPGPSIAAAQISANKYVQRCRARETGIDIPRFQLCTDLEMAAAAAAEIGFPVILKPVDNRGSFGVNKVDSMESLKDAARQALLHSHSRSLLVEEFIEGIHITVDGYAFPESGCRSLALATKGMLPGTSSQVAVDILYPGELPETLYQKACQTNEIVNRQLGYSFGMTHSEYMVTSDERVVLIESANRGGGCFTSEVIVPHVSGIDLTGQYIADAAGEATDRYAEPQKNRALLKFVTFPGGVIGKVHGMDRVRGDRHVLAARLAVRQGDRIAPVQNDANRHGFVICGGNRDTSADEIRALARSLLNHVEIEYLPQSDPLPV